MSLIKKIALVMAVVLVVGACAGLIVHKTTEGSQSVVKRPAEGNGSSGSAPATDDDVSSEEKTIPVLLNDRSGSTYTVSLFDPDGNEIRFPINWDVENACILDEIFDDIFLVSPGSVIHFSGAGDAKFTNRWYIDCVYTDGTITSDMTQNPVDFVVPNDCVLITVSYTLRYD